LHVIDNHEYQGQPDHDLLQMMERNEIEYLQPFSEDLIFLSASFKGIKSNFKNVNSEVIRMKSLKEKNQPMRIKTGGSTFKNPINQTNKKVWELIRESVSIDTKFGDAHISEKHSNFFVNKGNATFNDMKKLIDFVSKKVLEKTGIKLDKEIKILE